MCVIYLISFFFSMFGIFGVGHLFAGAPSKAVAYFIAGLIWSVIAVGLTAVTGIGILCLLPLQLIFAHFCAADAVRIARGG